MSEAWSVVIKVHSFDSKAEAKKFAIEAACTFQTIPGSKDLATSIKFEPSPPASPGPEMPQSES